MHEHESVTNSNCTVWTTQKINNSNSQHNSTKLILSFLQFLTRNSKIDNSCLKTHAQHTLLQVAPQSFRAQTLSLSHQFQVPLSHSHSPSLYLSCVLAFCPSLSQNRSISFLWVWIESCISGCESCFFVMIWLKLYGFEVILFELEVFSDFHVLLCYQTFFLIERELNLGSLLCLEIVNLLCLGEIRLFLFESHFLSYFCYLFLPPTSLILQKELKE